MCMMGANLFTGSMGFRPSPGCRKYFCFLPSLGLVLGGFARSKNWPELVNDLMAFMGVQISKIRHDGSVTYGEGLDIN